VLPSRPCGWRRPESACSARLAFPRFGSGMHVRRFMDGNQGRPGWRAVYVALRIHCEIIESFDASRLASGRHGGWRRQCRRRGVCLFPWPCWRARRWRVQGFFLLLFHYVLDAAPCPGTA
jgi:hypothetical protein